MTSAPPKLSVIRKSNNAADPFFGLIANNPFGVYLVNSEFRLIEVSLGAQKVFENVHPLYGRDFAEVIDFIWPEPFASEAIGRFRHTLATGESYQAPSFTEHRADIDAEEAYDWRIERVTLPDGQYGAVCYFYDLSERQRWEKALAESETRFRTLVDTIPALIFVCDPDGQTTYVGPSLESYAGLPAARVLRDGWLSVVHADDQERARGSWGASREAGRVHSEEYRFVDHTGDHRWFLVKVCPILNDGEVDQWVGSATDIQTVIESRATLRQLNEQLEEKVAARTAELRTTSALLAEETKQREATMIALAQSQKLEALGQLTSGIAHDFNNIVAAITGGFALIERRTTDPRIVELSNHGVKAAQRGAGLVKQLLAFAQDQVLIPKSIDVADLIKEATPLLQNAIGPRVHLKITCRRDAGLARIDQSMLDAALINLVINARDAMGGDGVIQISTRRIARGAQGWPVSFALQEAIAISVADNGPGMDAALLGRVMEPFFTTKEPGKGTGLGLAMVHGFSKQSGGLFSIESTVGKGTTATIYLPRLSASDILDEEVHQLALSESLRTHEHAKDLTFLVVDDDDQVRAVVCAQVEEFGYRTIAATSGANALGLLAERPDIDAVLSDIAMPDMDGLAMAAFIRLVRPDLPILFMSGYADRGLLEGENVLPKPFTIAGLGEAIGTLLAHRKNSAGA